MSRFSGADFALLLDLADEYQNFFEVKYSQTSDHLTISIDSADPAEVYKEECVVNVGEFIARYRKFVRDNLADRMH